MNVRARMLLTLIPSMITTAGCGPGMLSDDDGVRRTASATGTTTKPLLRVVNANIKHGGGSKDIGFCRHDSFGEPSQTGVNLAMVGLRRYWIKQALKGYRAGFPEMLMTLQEVDVRTRRVGNWDPRTYWTGRLNRAMGDRDIDQWRWDHHFSGRDYAGGQFGLLTLASNAPHKKKTLRESSTYQAVKLRAAGELFWVLNLHLTTDLQVSATQLEEVLRYVDGLHSRAHVLVVGDLNVMRDGYHLRRCPGPVGGAAWVSEGCDNHQRAYDEMKASFSARGFTEVGAFDGPCWKQTPSTCSFKATGRAYSRIDYVWLLVRENKPISATVNVERPYVDPDCILADHYALIIDIGRAN